MDEENWKEEKRKMLPFLYLQLSLSIIMVPAILYGGYYHCHSIPVPKSNEFGEKLLYAVRYCTFPQAVFLLITVVRVGSKRGRTPAGNPLDGKEHYVQVEKNILTNTVEQLLVFLLIVLALITYLEPLEMRIIPLYSLAFLIGRILFTVGYSIGPQYRTLGMVTNSFSNFFFVGYVIYLMYIHGFMYGVPAASAGSPSPTFGTGGKTEL